MKVFKPLAVVGAALLLPVFIGGLAAQESEGTHKGDPVKGKKVFLVTACWRCHDTDTGGFRRAGVPSLKGVFNRPPHVLSDGTKHEKHTDAMLRQIITEGTKAMNPRGAVLTDEELDDLIAYLHTL